jgi:hydrogenase-4 component E
MVDLATATFIINLLTGLMVILTIVLFVSNTTRKYVIAFTLQSIILTGLMFFIGYYSDHPQIYLAAVLTLALKGIVLPLLIKFVIKKINLIEEKESFVNMSASIMIAGTLVIFSYIIVQPILGETTVVSKNSLPFAVGIVMIGLFMIISKKKANIQVFGLLVMENGLSLAIISTTYELPIIVELGILVDVAFAVLILALFILRMNAKYSGLNLADLKELKEE